MNWNQANYIKFVIYTSNRKNDRWKVTQSVKKLFFNNYIKIRYLAKISI